MISCKLITKCGETTMILDAEMPQVFPGLIVRKGWFQSIVKHVGYDLADQVTRVYLVSVDNYNYDSLYALGWREIDEFGEVTE